MSNVSLLLDNPGRIKFVAALNTTEFIISAEEAETCDNIFRFF